jgi:hypothetical protein
MISETVYFAAKAYFMIAGIFYLYAIYTNNFELFGHVTGIISIIFLLSNIKWYFFKK